ncbi:unnamed protein product [Closterium sp. Naga37s-1]|nr:unnamed protein product [Closterium sp. Naga37s-1]
MGVRREESGEDLRIRSEPWRRPVISDPWNLAGGQRGMDGRRREGDVDVPTTSKQGDEEEGEEPQPARGSRRRGIAGNDGSPTARGGGRRVIADDDGSPTARGGGRRDIADDDDSPTARGGGRRDIANDDGSPTARGGGRFDIADDDGSPTARGGGRRDIADDDGSPTARGGGRRDSAVNGENFPVAREEGRQGCKKRDEGKRVRCGKARKDGEEDRNGERSPAGRREEMTRRSVRGVERQMGARQEEEEGKRAKARLGGSGGATEKDEKGAGEGDHRTAPEQKEEVRSEGSKSGIAKNVLLCKEIDNGKIKKGTRETAKKTRGEARVQLELGGCGNMERDRAGLERLVRGWNEHCTGSAQEAEEKKESSGGLLYQIGEDLGAGIWGDKQR